VPSPDPKTNAHSSEVKVRPHGGRKNQTYWKTGAYGRQRKRPCPEATLNAGIGVEAPEIGLLNARKFTI
jgi:hypothetical protein